MFSNSCCETPLHFQGLAYEELHSSCNFSDPVVSSRFFL